MGHRLPEYRDRGGYVLLQVPGEPFCQLRSFALSETYNGRGYAKARSVSFSGVRWQKCH